MPAPVSNVIPLLPLINAVTDRVTTAVRTLTDPPTEGYLSKPVDVPKLGDGVSVQRYWVLHPFVGAPMAAEADIADVNVDRTWPFQITVAASFPRDVYALATRIDDALFRWIPEVDGLICGPCKPPEGYEPGNAREDSAMEPPRFWLPLQYRTSITRAS